MRRISYLMVFVLSLLGSVFIGPSIANAECSGRYSCHGPGPDGVCDTADDANPTSPSLACPTTCYLGSAPCGNAFCTNNNCISCTPIDGGWSSYGNWSTCSSCYQARFRNCNNPSPSCGGAACTGLDYEGTTCGQSSTNWGVWSGTCGAPFCGQVYTRNCEGTVACGGTDNCTGSSTTTCSNVDNGAPAIPTLVSPIASAASPITFNGTFQATLVWNPVAGVNDRYLITVVKESTGTIIWNGSVDGAGSNQIVTNGTFSAGTVYRWYVQSQNTTCGTDTSGQSAYGYFRFNSPPTYTNLILRNSVGALVTADGNNRNHICESVFTAGGANGQQTYFEVYANDPDGANDITSIAFRIRNDVGTIASYTASFVNGVLTGIPVTSGWTYIASSGNSTGIGFLMQMNNPLYGTNMYHMEANVTDKWGASSGWVDTTRDFKIWDCNVNVSGTVYDGSAGLVCSNGTGFSVTAPLSMNFTSLSYGAVNMTVTPPATYSGGPLTWGQYYPISYPGVQGTGMDYRVNGANCSNLASVTLNMIDPYQNAVPMAVIDYSFIRNQEGWYQVVGGGIEARNTISSAVPVTCSMNAPCVSGLAINSVGVSNDGLVAAPALNVTSGCSDTCFFSSPRNISVGATVMYEKYSYEKIKNSYWGRLGLGTTLTGDKTLAEVITAKGTDGVVFVEGNVNVAANNLVPVGSFLMVVASGAITFDPAVTTAQGIFIANGAISASGTNNTALSISGMLYTLQNISFTRALSLGSANNSTPAVVVSYRPDFIFNSPPALASEISLKY